MHKVIEADQNLPHKLTTSKFFSRKQLRELLYIVKKNRPDLDSDEIIEMFKRLSETGCSCAFLANCLIERLPIDAESFQQIFGYSYLANSNNIDCNKIMVDIFSKLYGVIKAKLIKYEYYTFKNVEEATQSLLGESYSSDSEAFLKLFEKGYAADGFNPDGDLMFVSRNPEIVNCVGTCEQIAKSQFGIEGVKTVDELKKTAFIFGVTVEYKDLEIQEKFSGLIESNFNFWSNYYLQQYDVDFELKSEPIIVSDFQGNYQEFMKYIYNLISLGYSVSVSSTNNTDTYIHTNRLFSYTKISSKESGHIMKLKGFNKDGDFIVSSYGEEFILSKEYFGILEFKKISTKVISKAKNQEESNVVKVAL